jgi:hypothetical protein
MGNVVWDTLLNPERTMMATAVGGWGVELN